MANPNQFQPVNNQNVNQILDTIIAEKGSASMQSYGAYGNTPLIQKYIANIKAHNPITILATITPIALLVIMTVAISSSSHRPNEIANNGGVTELSSAEDNYRGSSDADEDVSTNTNTDNANTNETTITPTQAVIEAGLNPTATNNPSNPGPSVPIVTNPTAPPSTPAITDTFGIASWNSYFGNSSSNVANAAQELSGKGGDILAFQEVHQPSRRTAIKSKIIDCGSCKYSGYVQNYSTDGSSPASLPIYWNKTRFSLLNSGYVKVSDATGTDPNYISSK